MEANDLAPTAEDLIEEIAALLRPPEREPGEFSTKEYAEKLGITANQAARDLEQGERDGLLSVRRVLENGKWIRVWRRKK